MVPRLREHQLLTSSHVAVSLLDSNVITSLGDALWRFTMQWWGVSVDSVRSKHNVRALFKIHRY